MNSTGIEWARVTDSRAYMDHVARLSGIPANIVGIVIGDEAAQLKKTQPQAIERLTGGELKGIADPRVRDVIQEQAWLWIAGQAIIEREQREARERKNSCA